MKTKFFYGLAFIALIVGGFMFIAGYNDRMDMFGVCLLGLLFVAELGVLVCELFSEKDWYILCVTAVLMVAIGTILFVKGKQLESTAVVREYVRGWSIGLIIASMLLTTIPSLVKKNVVGAVLILLVEGGILLFISLCWRSFGWSHPFITGDFFWCTGGLFALALAGFAVLLFIQGWKTRNKKSGSQPKTLESEAEIEFPGGAAYFPTSQKPKEEPVDKTPCNLSEMPFKVFFGQCCQFIKEEVLGAGWTGIIAGCVILWGAVDLVLVHFGI